MNVTHTTRLNLGYGRLLRDLGRTSDLGTRIYQEAKEFSFSETELQDEPSADLDETYLSPGRSAAESREVEKLMELCRLVQDGVYYPDDHLMEDLRTRAEELCNIDELSYVLKALNK